MNTNGKLVALVVLAFLAGCIPVDDLGDYWDQGTVAPALEGHWKKQGVAFPIQDEFLSFEKAGDHYRHYRTKADAPSGDPKTPIKAKSIALGDHTFLMLVADSEEFKKSIPSNEKNKNEEDQIDAANQNAPKGLQRYTIDDKTLTFYYLNDGVLHDAIQSGQVAGKLPKQNAPNTADFSQPTIAKLDGNTARFLIELANDPKKWTRVERYSKVAGLQDALEASKAYPATTDTSVNSRVRVEQPDLKYFSSDDKQDILLRQLQASPEWKVFHEKEEIVCYHRQKSGDHWQVSLNGYESARDSTGHAQTRLLFRFAKTGGGAFTNKFNRNQTIVVNPLAGNVNLNMKASDQGVQSYLAVGQPGLWFEFFEQTDQEPRIRTRDTLDWLAEFLKNIRGAEAEIMQTGFASALMPRNAIRKGIPVLDIRDGFQGGIYDVHGWVNPGRDGRTYLKVFNVASGQRLSEERIASTSNERIGWSEDPNQLFFYNAHITVYEGDWDHQYQARFELWHRSDSGAETKLIELARTICGWQR